MVTRMQAFVYLFCFSYATTFKSKEDKEREISFIKDKIYVLDKEYIQAYQDFKNHEDEETLYKTEAEAESRRTRSYAQYLHRKKTSLLALYKNDPRTTELEKDIQIAQFNLQESKSKKDVMVRHFNAAVSGISKTNRIMEKCTKEKQKLEEKLKRIESRPISNNCKK